MDENHDPRVLTAKDLREAADLSYRQVNDWDAKGALPGERGASGSWRRFTPREVFAIAVCSEIRKRFGVPVTKLGFVREFMLQEGADHFSAAVRLMAMLGVGVYLLTDLEETFILDSELEFIGELELGAFGGNDPEGYVFLKVNPIVNRLLACLKKPIHLECHGKGYEILREVRDIGKTRSREESRLLELLRTNRFDKAEITFRDGTAKTFRGTSRHNTTDLDEIASLIESSDYQRVTVTRTDGRIVGVEQTQIEKLDE